MVRILGTQNMNKKKTLSPVFLLQRERCSILVQEVMKVPKWNSLIPKTFNGCKTPLASLPAVIRRWEEMFFVDLSIRLDARSNSISCLSLTKRKMFNFSSGGHKSSEMEFHSSQDLSAVGGGIRGVFRNLKSISKRD